MIGIDTNIVLRYLLKDDTALSPRALEIIAGNDCFVTRAALTEVVSIFQPHLTIGKYCCRETFTSR